MSSRKEAPVRRRSWFWPLFCVGLVGVLLMFSLLNLNGQQPRKVAGRALKLSDIPFNGDRSYQALQEICKIGPRVSGSEGMLAQQKWVEEKFTELGAKVSWQKFDARHPQDGSKVPMANAIIEWHPERMERILFCCHYDTRPFPDNDPDPRKRKGKFVGANDGASGVALFAELGRHIQELPGKTYGVDFVIFDGEELVFDANRDKYFLGSEYFAEQYRAAPPPHKYVKGVLVDMIADAELHLFYETNSFENKVARSTMLDIWETARKLGVAEFHKTIRHEIRDDHLALNKTAKIPTCDVIDFDYPRPGAQTYWHTTADVPEHCSALSLAKVGWVLVEWLKQQK